MTDRLLRVGWAGLLTVACSLSTAQTVSHGVVRFSKPAVEAPAPAPLRLPLGSPRIVVQKHRRRLLLFSGSRLLRTYAIGLGPNQIDDKTREGDGCTPEGRFYIAAKNSRSHYFKSLQISYPGTTAAARALKEKHIDVAQYRSILRAVRRQGVPPQNTPLGGQVFIHGGGSKSNWTLGCVALENNAMRELYSAAPKGTPILIEH